MSDETRLPDRDEIPDAVPERRTVRSLQLVWLVPIVAALIGLSLAVKYYVNRGPTITITFKSGEGIEAGKTKIKYKDVQVGEVREVAISRDRSDVIVTAELVKDAAGLLVEDTRFWVVRARISGVTISGLSTLMGGSYIGVDAGTSPKSRQSFVGLETPPVVTTDVPGRQFVLHARDAGSLDVGSPIFFRRIQVGEVTAFELDQDGRGVTMKAFIRSPYDRYVRSGTLFWHASGIDLNLDASGLKLNTESMVSILLGGIAFQEPDDRQNAQPAPPGAAFTLYPSKTEAMKRPETVVETYELDFRESVRGLSVGAPVDLRGVTVGEVTRINVEIYPAETQFVMQVEIQFYPERLKASYGDRTRKSMTLDSRKLLDSMVRKGFRAQLRSASLLTGQLYVALDYFPKAPPARIVWDHSPPEFPTVPASMEQLQKSLLQIVQKLEKLPLQEIAGDTRTAIKTLDTALRSADDLIRNIDRTTVPEANVVLKDVRVTLDSSRKALGGARKALAADGPLQQDLRETLREVARAAQSLRALADYLERNPESLLRGKKEEAK